MKQEDDSQKDRKSNKAIPTRSGGDHEDAIQSQGYQTHEKATDTADPLEYAPAVRNDWRGRAHRVTHGNLTAAIVTASAAAVSAVVTIIYTLTASLQWQELRRTNALNERAVSIARESLNELKEAGKAARDQHLATRRQLAAHMTVTEARLADLPVRPGDIGVANVTLQNDGQTAARRVRVFASLHKSVEALSEGWRQIGADHLVITVPAGASTARVARGSPLSADDLRSVSTGSINLRVEVAVEFEDVFGEAHFSSFCLTHHRKTDEWWPCEPLAKDFEKGSGFQPNKVPEQKNK